MHNDKFLLRNSNNTTAVFDHGNRTIFHKNMRFIPWAIVVALFASAYAEAAPTTEETDWTKYPCVAGFVEDKPGVGTLDFYFPTDWADDVQSVSGVSVKVAQEITELIGVC